MIEHSSPVASILFLFFAFFVGTIISYISSRSNHVIPYAVSIFIFGIAVSSIANVTLAESDIMIDGVSQWIQIDPDVLLSTLLPPLLFGEVMHLNFYEAKEALGSSALLAFPGAAFGAYILGLFCYYALPLGPDWSWRLCFIAGSILSATDPVSVIATLKGLVSSSISTMKLTYLIVGEALLNDGMALVLFTTLTSSELNTPSEIAIYFTRVVFFSPLVGIALGLGCAAILRISNRRVSLDDNIIQMTITVATAHISFVLAEYVVNVSGVISTVFSGIILSWLGASLILEPESMETIWEVLQWVGNTLIFMLAGIIVGTYIVYYSVASDYVLIILVYFYIFLTRYVMLGLCYPLLSRMSPGYSYYDVCFTSFAGLRGAVSLVLCIVLQKRVDSDYGDFVDLGGVAYPKSDIRHLVFIISGVVTLTILINGTLARAFYLYLYTKVDEKSTEADKVILHYVQKRIWRRTEEVLYRLQFILPYHNKKLVRKLCRSILPDDRRDSDADESDCILLRENEELVRSRAGSISAREGEDTQRSAGEKDECNKMHGQEQDQEQIGIAMKGESKEERVGADLLSLYKPSSPVRKRRAGSLVEEHKSAKETWYTKMDSNGDDTYKARIRVSEVRKKLERAQERDVARKLAAQRDADVDARSNQYNYSIRTSSDDEWQQSVEQPAHRSSPSTLSAAQTNNRTLRGYSDPSPRDLTAVSFGLSPSPYPSSIPTPSLVLSALHSEIFGSHSSSKSRMAGSSFNFVPRSVSSPIDFNLIKKFRIIFLRVVRLNYMKQVQSGRLPRGSYAAQVLFNSIDVGMATVHTDGLQDWDAVNVSLSKMDQAEATIGRYVNRVNVFSTHSSICILTSFIHAHQSAEDTILLHLGEQEGISTPEEAQVVLESEEIVKQAEMRIASMDSGMLALNVSKQAALMVLHAADDLAEQFVSEGILADKAAHSLFEKTRTARKDLDLTLKAEYLALTEGRGITGQSR